MNPASGVLRLATRIKRGRANQPGPTFSQSPGIIFETFSVILASAATRPGSFNELPTGYQIPLGSQRILMHTLLTDACV